MCWTVYLTLHTDIRFLCPGFKRCFMLLMFWTSGFTWFPSPTSEPRKLNVLSKSQQVQENLKPSSMQTSSVSELSLSLWLWAEKEIRRFVRGENGRAAGVFWKVISAVSLNVPGHTGYINKNSYGRDCTHLIIYLWESERKRHSQHIPCNIVTIMIISTIYWKNSSPKMKISLKSICHPRCR